eukprot:gene49284-33973_t
MAEVRTPQQGGSVLGDVSASGVRDIGDVEKAMSRVITAFAATVL